MKFLVLILLVEIEMVKYIYCSSVFLRNPSLTNFLVFLKPNDHCIWFNGNLCRKKIIGKQTSPSPTLLKSYMVLKSNEFKTGQWNKIKYKIQILFKKKNYYKFSSLGRKQSLPIRKGLQYSNGSRKLCN